MNIKIENGALHINIPDLFSSLSNDDKKILLEMFTIDQIFYAIERQLKHETEMDWWSTSGERDGGKIREKIIEIQGLESEFKKDLEQRIRSLERENVYYRKYYDWYFKVYHIKSDYGEPRLFDRVINCIGDVK